MRSRGSTAAAAATALQLRANEEECLLHKTASAHARQMATYTYTRARARDKRLFRGLHFVRPAKVAELRLIAPIKALRARRRSFIALGQSKDVYFAIALQYSRAYIRKRAGDVFVCAYRSLRDYTLPFLSRFRLL